MTKQEIYKTKEYRALFPLGFNLIAKKHCGIYALLHPITSEIIYIGKSKNIYLRYRQHIMNIFNKPLSKFYKKLFCLFNCSNKYPMVKLLVLCELKDLTWYEHALILKYKNTLWNSNIN